MRVLSIATWIIIYYDAYIKGYTLVMTVEMIMDYFNVSEEKLNTSYR